MNSPLSSFSWISSPVFGGPRSSVPVPYLRKEFRLDHAVKAARLTVTALGLYEVEINGSQIGDQVFAPGWTDYNTRVPVQSYDVTKLLKMGDNTIGTILGDGWYCGFVAWKGRQNYGDRPEFLAALEITFTDGSTTIIGTDNSWKTSTGPILESDFLMGEAYDARRELDGWSQPGYNDSSWEPVLTKGPRQIILDTISYPPVRRLGEITPTLHDCKGMRQNPPPVYDMGQNFSGRTRIRIKAPRGTTLCFFHAEVLNPDGSLYTDNLRSARAMDYYTCKGGETETWEPRFTFHGFRYVEVQGIPEGASFEMTGIVLHSDTPPTGSFSCSHPLLNQLQHNIVWGQKSNFLEVPTDCPQRDERLGWTGDAQVFIRTAAFNMDVREFFHKWLQDARDSQSPEGAVPSVVPSGNIYSGWQADGGPAWADATIICPWTLYLCYDDRKILEDHYDSMCRFVDFMAKHRSLNHIRSHPDVDPWGGYGDWLALDGSGKIDGATPKELIGTAFYAYDTAIMARVAEVLGRPGDAARFTELHGQIVKAFNRRFVTADGLLASGTQTAYVLALHFNLLPKELRPAATRELVRDIEKRHFHIATGFVGTPYILDVLEENGHLDIAYKLLEQEKFPSWLFPVNNGATTIWERWDGWTPDKGFQSKSMNSFNHYAYGAVGAWMYRTVAGLELDPAEPGYRHIIFRPRPGGSITWAKAELKTPQGTASISWKLENGKLDVECQVPEGARATFLPPAGYPAEPVEWQAGTHHLSLSV